MFRRTDESDWSRFAKGGNREGEAPESTPPADAADLPPPLGSAQGLGMSRPSVPDVPVTVPRPAPASPASPGGPAPGAADGIETVVGPDSSVQGTLRSEHNIRIQGSAQGEIESKRAVFVEENARVSATVTAAEITISGQLDGEVRSVGRVEITPSGRITGVINAAILVMHEGAFFDGQMKMKNRGQPEPGPTAEREAPPGAAGRRISASAAPPPGRGTPPGE